MLLPAHCRYICADVISSMADSLDVFHTKCSAIVARMIDAVPAGVELTKVLTPVSVKPSGIKLVRTSSGDFKLHGSVRVGQLSFST
jgi:hypothetical protein